MGCHPSWILIFGGYWSSPTNGWTGAYTRQLQSGNGFAFICLYIFLILKTVGQRYKLKGWISHSHHHFFFLSGKSNSLFYKTVRWSGHGNDIRGTLCLWKVAENFPMWSSIYVQGLFLFPCLSHKGISRSFIGFPSLKLICDRN